MTTRKPFSGQLVVGLDIGGTKFLVASATQDGVILKRMQCAAPQDLQSGIHLLHEMIAEVSEQAEISAIGATIGGPLDWQTGVVSPLHQPAWREVPLKEIIQQHWNCPFWVDVDTNLAALGEFHFGGETAPHLLYITLSTGMGGGYLINGHIYRGMAGGHPEVGHMSINFRCRYPERITCECGAPDCLEALVSGNAIRRIYGRPAELLDEDEWEEVGYNLGQGLRNMAVIYHPDVIVLGGGVAYGRGEKLIKHATQVMTDHMRLVAPPLVRLSHLGYDTALMGAIAAAIYGID